MTQSTSIWQNVLLAELPGATWDFVEQVLAEVVNEFYTWTGAWIEPLSVDLREGRVAYHLNPVPGRDVDVVYVRSATRNGMPLNIVEPAVGMQGMGDMWVWPAAVVNLVEAPRQDSRNGLRLIVALRPLPCSHEVPDDAGREHFDTIKNGALGRLKAMPNKPWFDGAGANIHQRRFRNGMAQARDMAAKGYARAAPSWSFPRWA